MHPSDASFCSNMEIEQAPPMPRLLLEVNPETVLVAMGAVLKRPTSGLTNRANCGFGIVPCWHFGDVFRHVNPGVCFMPWNMMWTDVKSQGSRSFTVHTMTWQILGCRDCRSLSAKGSNFCFIYAGLVKLPSKT